MGNQQNVANFKHFETVQSEGVVVLRLKSGDLIARLITDELQEEMVAFADLHAPEKLVIDFDGIRRCSTATINALLRTQKQVKNNRGDVRLCGMSPSIREAFRVLNLDGGVFDIRENVEQAIASF